MKTRKFLSVVIAVVMIIGMLPGTMLTAFAAENPETVLTLTTKSGAAETDTFTYGDVITIEATAVSGSTVASGQTIGLYKVDLQIVDGVHITPADENGTYTITIDTNQNALEVGEHTLTVKFEGDSTMPAAQADVTLTLEITKLVPIVRLSSAFVFTKIYDGNPFIVTEDMFELNNITWDQLTHIWYKDSIDEANKLVEAPAEVGDYVLVLYAPGTTNTEEVLWQSPPVTIAEATSAPVPATYDLWVGGEQLTSEKLTVFDGSDGAATYNPETNTLTLDGINITSGYKDENDRVIGIYADGNLNIELAGENDITMPEDNNKSCGIWVKGDLSVSGSGSLNVVAGNVTAQDIEEHYSTGIHTGGYLNIYGAIVYARGGNVSAEGDSYSRGVYLGGGLQLYSGGTLTAEGGDVNGSIAYSTGLEALGEEEYINISVYDGNLIAKGGDTEGVIIAESNGVYLEIAGFYVYDNTANVELTCGNAKVTSDDESAKPYAYSNGITVYEGDIAIYGGTVEITGGTWEGIDGDGWAVYVEGEEDEEAGVVTGGNVLIKWENIEISPSGYECMGPNVTITSTDEENGAVFAKNGLEIGDKLIISEPEGGRVTNSEDDYVFDTILDADDSLAKKVVIVPLIYFVKIKVSDYKVTVAVPNNMSINEVYKDMLEDAEITDFSDSLDTNKSGYTFEGFYTESGEKFDFDKPVSGDMTITAKWKRKSSGGGSSSTTTTTTTKNDDGSTTKTTTNKATGTTTETTTYPDGSTTKVETKKDGTVTTTEKNKDGSEKVTEEKADGTTVTTEKDTDGTKTVTTKNPDGSRATEETQKDGTKVTTETNADGETTAEVEAKGETEVVIPVPDAEDVTKVVVTGKDGQITEAHFEVKDSGVAITVSGNSTVSVQTGHICYAKDFTDVDTDSWYHLNIDYVLENGLMKGTATDKFAPNDNLTRAMLVTVLYRLEGEPRVSGITSFADLEKDQYYLDAVCWAQLNGIVNGVSETEFAPNDNITREQIAAILYRYAIYKGMDAVNLSENLGFKDADDISEYALSGLNWAVGSGLIKGRTEVTLNPLDNATRAEIAAILHRFIETNQ